MASRIQGLPFGKKNVVAFKQSQGSGGAAFK
jgi:hypothetical protein